MSHFMRVLSRNAIKGNRTFQVALFDHPVRQAAQPRRLRLKRPPANTGETGFSPDRVDREMTSAEESGPAPGMPGTPGVPRGICCRRPTEAAKCPVSLNENDCNVTT